MISRLCFQKNPCTQSELHFVADPAIDEIRVYFGELIEEWKNTRDMTLELSIVER